MATEQGNRIPSGGRADITHEGQRIMGTGTRLASNWLGSQKSAIANRLHDAALGLRNISGNLEDRPNLREYVEAAADGIDTISEEVERRDLEELARSAEDVIRRQPALVFGGLMLAGLLVTRMLRSDQPGEAGMDMPRSGSRASGVMGD